MENEEDESSSTSCCSKLYPSPKYEIQKLADEFSTSDFEIEILFLPIAHPGLNPIEMVWSFMKRFV